MAPNPSRTAPTQGGRRRRVLKTVAIAAVVLFLLAQLLPIGRDHTNPSIAAEPAWDSLETRTLFARACADCHSNETVWPWYSNVAPISWLIARDVVEGREKLNVSEWGLQENEAGEAVETYENGEMPPPYYVPLHASARLSPAEKATLLKGLEATFGRSEGDEGGEDGDES